MSENDGDNGLGGWLFLVGIGVVFSPIVRLVNIVPLYKGVFENGAWGVLTEPGSGSYIPYFATLFVGETIYNAVMLLAGIYLIYLYFSKRHLFPKFFIVIALVTPIFILLDSWAASKVMPDLPVFDPETLKSFIRTFIYMLIWVPYMLISKRVQATFIKRKPFNQISLSSETGD